MLKLEYSRESCWWPGSWHHQAINSNVINSLLPNDSIWHQKYRSTLAEVMTCCLMAPSRYMNQCWLLISEVCGIHLRAITQWVLKLLLGMMSLKKLLVKLLPHLPGANELIVWNKQFFIFHVAELKLHVPSRCWEIIENVNIFLCFLKFWTGKGSAILLPWLITQTPVSGSCCLPLGALQSMWATWCKI